jgi:1-phosphatidylinositol-4-phosphate 5-kinase
LYTSIKDYERKKRSGWAYHVCALSVSILTVLYCYVEKKLGRNRFGSCSLDADGFFALILSVFGLCFSVSFAGMIYLKMRKLLTKKTMKMAILTRNFYNFYGTYLKLCIVYWVLISLAFLAQEQGINQNPYIGGNGSVQYDYRGILFNLGRFGQIIKALSPIIFFSIRVRDPMVNRKIKNAFCWSKGTGLIRERSESLNPDMNHELDLALASETDDMMWVNYLSVKIRESLHRTFLGCISSFYSEMLEEVEETTSTKGKDDTQNLSVIRVKGRELMQRLDAGDEDTMLDCTFTAYSPTLFLDVVRSYFGSVNFQKSLSIFENSNIIKRISEDESKVGSGGSSGEFFFLSEDRKIILKSINESDSKTFVSILYNYSEHFRVNPRSQIARIYGLFEFKFSGTTKSIKLIAMECLDPLFEGALRKYDLKGSEHARTVLKHKGMSYKLDSSIKGTLKDNDFVKLDEGFNPDLKSCKEFLGSLKKDSMFFRLHQIIDYSLIVSIVDKTRLPQGYLEWEKSRGNYRIMESITDPNICYFFGVVDYFQLFNFNKRLERTLKRLMKCNPKLETSSQPPKRYSRRFYTRIALYFTLNLRKNMNQSSEMKYSGTDKDAMDL